MIARPAVILDYRVAGGRLRKHFFCGRAAGRVVFARVVPGVHFLAGRFEPIFVRDPSAPFGNFQVDQPGEVAVGIDRRGGVVDRCFALRIANVDDRFPRAAEPRFRESAIAPRHRRRPLLIIRAFDGCPDSTLAKHRFEAAVRGVFAVERRFVPVRLRGDADAIHERGVVWVCVPHRFGHL